MARTELREEGRRRHFLWEDGATAAVACLALVFCVKGRSNYAAFAFLPFAVPAVLAASVPAYRRRALAAARSMWQSLDDYPEGGKTPWRAALAFVVVPAALVYLSNNHFDLSLDSCPVVPTAISLVNEGNTDLDEFYRDVFWWKKSGAGPEGLPYFLQRSGRHLYSTYPAGMVPLALPVVGFARITGARLSDPNVQTRLEKLTASALAAMALGVFFLIALHLVRPAPALATTAILAFSSGMSTTVAQNLWQHDGVILGVLLVLLIEFRGCRRWGMIAQGLICGALPACRVTSAAFLIPFGVWVLLRSPRRALAVVGVAAVTWLPWALYYLSLYGSPFGPSSGQMHGRLWSADVAVPLAGVLLSPGRGLLTYQPWLVIAPLAVLPAVRRAGRRQGLGGPAGWEFVCVAAAVLLAVVVSAWNCWWGGFCWGSRLMIEVVPLCGLMCARPIAAMGTSKSGRAAVLGLAILGALVHVPLLYLGAYHWNEAHAGSQKEAVWSWSHAPFLAPFNHPGR